MTAFDHQYPPGEWTAAAIERVLDDAPEQYPVPTYADADRWRELRNHPTTAPIVEELLDDAEEERGAPVPALPATMSLEWVEDGSRTYQGPSRTRIGRLSTFALAECFEREGRYLDDVLDYAWAFCEQAGWAYPTNFDDGELVEGLPVEAPPEDRYVDIRKCETALLLAEIDHVLGDLLHPALRERIRVETDRRLFRPYEAREDFHWYDPPAHNKNAVCNNRTLSAAMYLLDDTERLAGMIEKGARSLGHYLAGFDHDGATAEGVGYWSYGFRHYVMLAAQIEARTDGALSLRSPPVVEEIARFPMRVELSPGRYPPFSDGRERVSATPSTHCWLGDRLDIPWFVARGLDALDGRSSYGGFPRELRDLAWCAREPPTGNPTPPTRAFFPGHQWWIAREDPADPDALVVAAKGGYNDEPHNHNDCGTFVVDTNRELLLTDLGAPSYQQYHGGRYDALPARSLGHSVPYVNGCEQAPGESAASSVVDRVESASRDAVTYELADCYPSDAQLASLRRSIALERDGPRVLVEDQATFDPEASRTDLTSVLVSYAPVETADAGLHVRGESGAVSVGIDGDVAADAVAVERLDDAVQERNWSGPAEYADVWRARIPTTGDADPTVSLRIEPVGR